MKLKYFLFFAVLVLSQGMSEQVFAQMSTGRPTSKVIRTGNRAEAGDFGFYVGANMTVYDGLSENGTAEFSSLPMLNFKYMMSDEAELRLGLELYKSSETLDGEYSQSVYNEAGTELTYSLPTVGKQSSSSAMFYPGIAYHFSSRNILDVYIGAELPIGWDSSTSLTESGTLEMNSSGNSYTVNTSSNKITKRSFVIGLGAFIGLQAYIADLPLALGVEFGVSSRYDTGLKYKHQVESNGIDAQTYYTTELNSNIQYDKLKARQGETVGQARLTLTYYFK